MLIFSNLRLTAIKNKALLQPVKDLTLSTLQSIANDPKDPRQQQAQREVDRRKQQVEQSKAPERAREKADKARAQAAKERDKSVKKQKRSQKAIKPASKSNKLANINVLNSPIAQ